VSPRPTTTSRQGNYAGAVSRLAAFAADVGIAWATILLILGMASAAISYVIPGTVSLYHDTTILTDVILVLWFFTYFAYQWALSGKTLGMAIFGLRVVTAEGAPITGRQAAIRTLFLPVSLALAIFALTGIIYRVDHRAWHDRVAKTCVVYDWDARAARLLWLARQHDQRSAGRTPIH
jgi:uncharacterized RDD family membrane protein YckC